MQSIPNPSDRGVTPHALDDPNLATALDDPCLAAVLDALETVAPVGSLWEVSRANDGSAYSVGRQDDVTDFATMLQVQTAVLAGVMTAAKGGTGWAFDIHEGGTGLTVHRLDLDDEAVA